ncbi:MAG: YceI family protein, partial [Ferruginibacter sp.]
MAKKKWVLDPSHSEVQFKVKHLMISTVTGYFKEFTLSASVEDDNFIGANDIEFSAAVDSINTKDDTRDQHLKSADFFDSAKHSHIIFLGKGYFGTREEGELVGNLTIKEITKSIAVNI